MNKVVATTKAPQAIGPYSQGIKVTGGLIFVSGQIPLVPETGEIVAGGIAEQAAQVLENLKAIVEAAGSTLANVIKTTVYLKDIGDFAAVNTIYAKYFTENCPARVCVEVSNLPKGALIEIDVIATPGTDYSD